MMIIKNNNLDEYYLDDVYRLNYFDISGDIVIGRSSSSQVVVQVHLPLYTPSSNPSGPTVNTSSSPRDSSSVSVSVLGQCLQHNT